MKFSSPKAREIHERLRFLGKINSSIALAEKNYMSANTQAQSGQKWSYDGPGLRDELKRELASSIQHAEDKDWDEIAKWLFDLATLAKK